METTSNAAASQLLSTKAEAAKRLRISTRTLDKLIALGEIQCVRIGGAVRFSEEALAAFIARDHKTQ